VGKNLDAETVQEKLEELKGVLEEGIDTVLSELGLTVTKKDDEEEEEPEAEDSDEKEDDKEDEDDADDDDDEKGDDEDEDDEKGAAFPSLKEIDGLDGDDLKTLASSFGDKFATRLLEKKEKTQREVLKILVALATGEDYDAEEKYVAFASKLTGKEIGDLEDYAKEVMKSLSSDDDDKKADDEDEDDDDEDDDEEDAKSKKGKKDDEDDDKAEEDEEEDDSDDEDEEEKPKKRGRGRPPGSKNGVKKEEKKGKPGRPKKK